MDPPGQRTAGTTGVQIAGFRGVWVREARSFEPVLKKSCQQTCGLRDPWHVSDVRARARLKNQKRWRAEPRSPPVDELSFSLSLLPRQANNRPAETGRLFFWGGRRDQGSGIRDQGSGIGETSPERERRGPIPAAGVSTRTASDGHRHPRSLDLNQPRPKEAGSATRSAAPTPSGRDTSPIPLPSGAAGWCRRGHGVAGGLAARPRRLGLGVVVSGAVSFW
jgi:hypothetical protein